MKIVQWFIVFLGIAAVAIAVYLTADLTNTIICLAGSAITALGIGMLYRDRVYGFSKQKAAIANTVEKWKQSG